jgi:transposase
MPDFAQLQLHFVDHIQWRYEVIRPLVLFAEPTPAQRAAQTQTHPDTVRRLLRQFRHQGMRGWFSDRGEVGPPQRGRHVPDAVVEELHRLKALSPGFHYRELVRILFCKLGYTIDDKTVKTLWQHSPIAVQGELPFGAYHRQADRTQARLQVIKLYDQGWNKRSSSHFLHVSRPTIDRWIARFEAEHMAGLADKSRAPKAPTRKVWLPLMIEIYPLQKRHPDAGRFRLWSLLARADISERTVGRVMALNRLRYDDIPHQRHLEPKPTPQPQPYKATRPHQYWFIDGRQMDFAIDGVKWWSIIVLDGSSRTMLAGATAPSEASWVALMVLYTACLRYGAPQTLISDSGGADISADFEAVCHRLESQHEPIKSTKGQSYLNWMETHFNVQRRWYDYQCSLTTTPVEFEQAHQAFMHVYNTTAPQGLLEDRYDPPIPLVVLGEAKGRRYTADELTRQFSQALFPRTTNPYGCVTLHSYHVYGEQGVPKTQVLLWVYGEQLRAVVDNVVLAEYRCRYDWRERKVRDIHDGIFPATRFASPQLSLLPLTPAETLVLYRPKARGRQARLPVPVQQLWLFELVPTG